MRRRAEPALEVTHRIVGRRHPWRGAAVGLQPEVRARQLAIELLGELRDLRPQARLHAVALVGADLPEPAPLQRRQRQQQRRQHARQHERSPRADGRRHEGNLAPDIRGGSGSAADFTLLTGTRPTSGLRVGAGLTESGPGAPLPSTRTGRPIPADEPARSSYSPEPAGRATLEGLRRPGRFDRRSAPRRRPTITYDNMRSTTRRFSARPALVLLSETGFSSPYEITLILCSGTWCVS